jgi:CcmD family protein
MDLNTMMAGYLIIWMLAFGFILSMWHKSRRLERELEAVRSMVEQLDRE